MSLEEQLWIWYHEVAKGSSYLDREMKVSASVIPWSKEDKVGSRMNLPFSSSKTLRVKGLEILDEEAMGFSSESSIEEEEEDSCTEGSRSP